MSYDLRCSCSECQQTTLFLLARSALPPGEFVQRAEQYELNEKQREIVEKIKLESWNTMVKGEKA